MKRKVSYTNEPLGHIKVVADFLPPPAGLASRVAGRKVTHALSTKRVSISNPKLRSTRRSTSE